MIWFDVKTHLGLVFVCVHIYIYGSKEERGRKRWEIKYRESCWVDVKRQYANALKAGRSGKAKEIATIKKKDKRIENICAFFIPFAYKKLIRASKHC